MSVSATTTTLIGLAEVLICGAAVALLRRGIFRAGVVLLSLALFIFGGPSGKAVPAGPVTCAASTSFLPPGLKFCSNPPTSGMPWIFSTGICHRIRRGRDQRREIGLGVLHRLENAGGRHVDLREIGGDGIVVIEIGLVQREPGDVIHGDDGCRCRH